jgi:hypothetical protein
MITLLGPKESKRKKANNLETRAFARTRFLVNDEGPKNNLICDAADSRPGFFVTCTSSLNIYVS